MVCEFRLPLPLMDLTMCNAWLLYTLEHKRTHPDLKCLNLYEFKRNVSECWLKQNVPTEHRRLRNRSGRPASHVPRGLRFDGKDHWPHCFSGYDGRARCVHCNSFTNMYCLKCEVSLCCNFMRNCFISYHTEDNNEIIFLPEWLMPHPDFSQSESDLDDPESDLDDPDSEPYDTESDSADPESDTLKKYRKHSKYR